MGDKKLTLTGRKVVLDVSNQDMLPPEAREQRLKLQEFMAAVDWLETDGTGGELYHDGKEKQWVFTLKGRVWKSIPDRQERLAELITRVAAELKAEGRNL